MKYAMCLLWCCFLQAAEPARVYTLDGPWKAHLGDDPRWAEPDFDDSAWSQLTPPVRTPGFAWYRRRFEIPAGLNGPVALWFPSLAREAEIYVNGRLVLQHGQPGRWTSSRWGPAPIIDLGAPSPGTSLVIARRERQFKNAWWSIPAAPRLGTRSAIADSHASNRLGLFQEQVSWLILGLLNLVFAAAAVAFWRMQPDQPVYFWFAIIQASQALWGIPQFATSISDLPALWVLPGDALLGVELVAWIFLFQNTPAWPGWRKVRFAALAMILVAASNLAAYAGILDWRYYFAFAIFQVVLMMALVWRGITKLSPGARAPLLPLLAPWLLYESGWLAWNIRSLLNIQRQSLGDIGVRGLAVLQDPFQVDLSQAGSILSILTMGGILLARFHNVTRDQQLLSSELEAARRVQELLVPAAESRIPGFDLGSAYMPAQSVGGDFFQVAPLEGGGVLVLTGDVSGKGLRAAMVVSLMVGAFRNRHSHRPAEILKELNSVLCGQMAGGFVTCVCSAIGSDGRATIANAGHPPPYGDGRELVCEAGLPLGISPDAEYVDCPVMAERFTFLSDGVVEAENAQRELFGFDRTREISTKSAQEIADAAKAWGQNDDITVVTVRRNS